MRNKLKRSNKCEDAPCPSREQPRTAEVIRNMPTGISTTQVKPLQEQRKTFCPKYVKFAPIFLRTTKQSQSKRSRDVKLDQPADKVQELVLPDVQLGKSQQRASPTERKRSWRAQLSASALHICMEEIQTSNPALSVQTVFNTLQKKASERLQNVGSTAENSRQIHLTEKRKRVNENSERVFKRLRSSVTAEDTVGMGHCPVSTHFIQEYPVPLVQQQRRSNKLSRTHRLRQQSGGPAGLVNHCEPLPLVKNQSESCIESLKISDILQKDSSFEDVLWTDKYSPQHISEVIGNSASVNKLQSWLKKWKLRADCDERRKMEEKKQEDNSNDSWDCGDFQGEGGAEGDREEPLCNTMLITGPQGVGKTASVYACAQELGFKVFEVNCSSQRSGRHVLSQLKEATRSHLVEMPGKDPLKPTYFNNYSINSCTPRPDTLPGKTVRPKNITCTSKRKAAQNLGHPSRKGKANQATVTLTNYFKMKAKADRLHFGDLLPSDEPDGRKPVNPSPGSDQTVPQNKKTATSLILFEEVDVIFHDDVGFFSAIKTFMTTTKRPVVLTTNDPLFRERFNCSLEEIIFKTPSVVNLQLWLQSGGGRTSCEELTHVQHLSGRKRGQDVDLQLPKSDPCCAASMLGLHTVTQNQLSNVWSENDTDQLLRLLAESWRGGVPLLYSNLELLLPAGAPGSCAALQNVPDPPDIDLHIKQLDGYVSIKASATNSKSVKNISRLSRKKCITAMIDDTSSSSLTQRTPLSSKRAPPAAATKRDKTEEKAARVETDCLDALTDFFDLMSYLDSTMPAAAAPLVSGRPETFEGLLDVQAAAEGLGFHRCCYRVSEAWTEAQKYKQEVGDASWRRLVERLTLPASSKHQSLSFSFQPPCAASVCRRRYELSRKVLGSKSFGLLGNRRAVSVDYMPVLRYICRSQREQKEEPVGCLNYLSSTHLGLSKSTIQLLAEDFP
ncbi:ATPase family AAA domain containing protein 5 [Dissostichus eleginoides]|uniref:ATPase family AAA domain containing protein 5 n=1 Tax=Dissostichus eleginoides TaxID=100907 RepID=A0AAD9BMZ0_DISEL|nr:ATPase family AAA domain containing protein 5 [Dissostichus eleginoides]